MDWSQATIAVIYIGAAGFAAIHGRFAPMVWAIVLGNFIGSMTFKGLPIETGIVDALTLALLIAEFSNLSLALAWCFTVCIAVYAFAAKVGLQPATTSTIVDWMILPIALIIGCLNGGGGHLSRLFVSRGPFARRNLDTGNGHSLETRGDASHGLAQDRGIRKGVGHAR